MEERKVFPPVWRVVALPIPDPQRPRDFRIRRMNYGELLRFAQDTNAVEPCICDADGRQLFGPGGSEGIRFTEADHQLASKLLEEVCRERFTLPQ